MSLPAGQTQVLGSAPTGDWRPPPWALGVFLVFSFWVVQLALRLVLYFHFTAEKNLSTLDLWKAFLIGAHLDLFIATIFSIPILGATALLPRRWFSAWRRLLMGTGLLVFWMVQVFLLFAEYYFFEEFKSRFNTVAVDYLLYPHEVFVNIWDVYPVPVVLLACAGFSISWIGVAHRLFPPTWSVGWGRKEKVASLLPNVLLLLVLLPTVSLKEYRFSNERLLNELANNGTISFLNAAWTRHLDFSAFYKTLPKDEAYQRARRLLAEPRSEWVEEGRSLRRRVAGDASRPRLNVVIFLEESLGSEFWGSLGRKEETLMPEMDRLAAQEGMLFSNIYASGNRTVRGFEGVLSSFPPLPGDSIVKRHLSDNVETIARVLKRDGYETVFLYGGRGLFDGMRSFSVRNGYDRFIEQKDFSKPTFATIWGVCNEDLYDRALQEFRVLAKAGKPFHATILSVSNHKPYTYPKGRIPEDPDKRQRAHAVKYTDYALGRFFKEVRQESFFTNTIFVVVADHGARVYGSQSIPIHSYEIPLLIVGPAAVKTASRVPALGCSLDVAPTILGLLNRPYESLFFGRDLLKDPPDQGRVLINHNRDIGIFRDERLLVLGLNKTAEFYAGDPKQKEMVPLAQPTPADLEVEKDAIALFQTADDLYMSQRYRIDK